MFFCVKQGTNSCFRIPPLGVPINLHLKQILPLVDPTFKLLPSCGIRFLSEGSVQCLATLAWHVPQPRVDRRFRIVNNSFVPKELLCTYCFAPIPCVTTGFSNHLGIEGLEPSALRMKVGDFYVRYNSYLIKAPLPEPYRHLSMHTAL